MDELRSKLSELLLDTHVHVPFNSTVFADSYEPRSYRLGGDCIDQVIFMSDNLVKLNLDHKIISFNEPSYISHAGIVVEDEYYLDPAMGLTVPINVNGNRVELNIPGYSKIYFSFSRHNGTFTLTVESPDGRSTRSTNDTKVVESLIDFQTTKKVERLSIILPIIPNTNPSFIKIKQDSTMFWYILNGKSFKGKGTISDTILTEFSIRANLPDEEVIKLWRESEKLFLYT